jgi:2-(1,2-epoxy-1,2-dihydrophenyl)acetyl-CoA isomerase
MQPYEHLLMEQRDGVARITLNRPDKLNSFNVAMHLELHHALDAVRDDVSVRAVLLTGAGRGFCAGQDLGDRAVAPTGTRPDLGESLEKYYGPLVRRLRAIPKPVVCAVNGVAAGAGANIALACDIVVASTTAKFIQPFAKLGLVPDAGGTWMLPQLVGRARAMGLAMLGSTLTAEQAVQWGLIWEAVAPETLEAHTLALAAQLAAGPTQSFARIKQAMDAAATNDLNAQLNMERDLQRELGASDDYAEGVKAFGEKRSPVFTGR